MQKDKKNNNQKKVQAEIFDLRIAAAYLNDVKIHGGIGLFFLNKMNQFHCIF